MRALLSSHLGKSDSFGVRLARIHREIKQQFPSVARVAIAIYDAKTDELHTFAHSSGPEGSPLVLYTALLSASPTLQHLAVSRESLATQDLRDLPRPHSEHTRRVLEHGYRSNFVMPMFAEDVLLGFLFFDSYEVGSFPESTTRYLELFAHVLTLVVLGEQNALRALLGTIQVARSFARLRDVETGMHLERMARYARIIAEEIAPEFDRDDEWVEHLFLFTPLHDVGKIGVPDAILRKPGKLDVDELQLMRQHVEFGDELLLRLLSDFNLTALPHIPMLRAIVRWHHESLDGTGYPDGLRGAEIPPEARVAAVADVFDALTSSRPYKHAWSNETALATLRQMAESKLDPRCVEALARRIPDIIEVQRRFAEDAGR